MVEFDEVNSLTDIESIIKWLRENEDRMKFGDMGIIITKHQGQILKTKIILEVKNSKKCDTIYSNGR